MGFNPIMNKILQRENCELADSEKTQARQKQAGDRTCVPSAHCPVLTTANQDGGCTDADQWGFTTHTASSTLFHREWDIVTIVVSNPPTRDKITVCYIVIYHSDL